MQDFQTFFSVASVAEMVHKVAPKALIVALSLLLSACASLPDPIDPTKDWSAARLYDEAKSALNNSDYEEAIKYFESLESRYPFGKYAQQAQLEVAYGYYKFDEPESALAAANRFIKLHPRHKNVDYAYYLKGLINFNRSGSFLDAILPQDPATRDPGSARQAFFDFGVLVKRFPNSIYTRDARQRMVFLRNNLANHEVYVARYYIKRKAYVAAANRAKYVIEHFDKSTAMPAALAVLIEAYDHMGLTDLSKDTWRVLSSTFPKHRIVAELEKQRTAN